MRRAALGFAVVLGLVAALASPIASAPRAAPAPPPRAQLISAGTSPRSTLRMAVAGGTVAQARMQLTESIRQSSGGTTITSVDTPPVTVDMQVTAGTPTATGTTPISYRYSNTAVVNDGSLSAAQLAQYQSALAPLNSLTGTAKLTPLNQLLDSKVAGTEQLEPAVAQLESQLADQLGSLSAPFPRQAVGIGARWRVTSSLHVSGIDARQVAEYTLRAHDGNQVGVDVTLTQTAPPQSAELPGVPKGTKVRITKWNVSGTGNATMSLDRPGLPLTSMAHASGTQTFAVSAQGQKETLNQKISTDVKVSS
jgi:hypothetical protein